MENIPTGNPQVIHRKGGEKTIDELHPKLQEALKAFIAQCATTLADAVATEVEPKESGSISFQIMLVSQALEETVEAFIRDYPHIHSAYDYKD